MWRYRGGRPASWAGAGIAFAVVLLIVSPQAPNGPRGTLGFVLLAASISMPAVWWLICQRLRLKRRYWPVIGTVSALLAVAALLLFPPAEQTPFGSPS